MASSQDFGNTHADDNSERHAERLRKNAECFAYTHAKHEAKKHPTPHQKRRAKESSNIQKGNEQTMTFDANGMLNATKDVIHLFAEGLIVITIGMLAMLYILKNTNLNKREQLVWFVSIYATAGMGWCVACFLLLK